MGGAFPHRASIETVQCDGHSSSAEIPLVLGDSGLHQGENTDHQYKGVLASRVVASTSSLVYVQVTDEARHWSPRREVNDPRVCLLPCLWPKHPNNSLELEAQGMRSFWQ